MKNNKIVKGQYYTKVNPFAHPLFYDWMTQIKNFENKIILEPFCGINSIPEMFFNMNYFNNWHCFDIDKTSIFKNKVDVLDIVIQDCLKKFPKGYKVAITNPPYLSRSSAKRKKLKFPNIKYDNLYKMSLHLMLKNVDYVAAVLPETFILQSLFKKRLFGVISLNTKVFSDTEYPVCLALFVPKQTSKYWVYSGKNKMGYYQDFQNMMIVKDKTHKVKFNMPTGEIGLRAIDDSYTDSICFMKGDFINSDLINKKTRHITRLSVETDIAVDVIIKESNLILKQMREQTNDLFLASFKGLRKDGKYRRRLDYKTARFIINKAVENHKNY